METMNVRGLVLAAHAGVRELADEVDELAVRTLREPKVARRWLERRLIDLLDLVAAHMDLEDRLLRPTLRDIDAWGEARVARMDKDHLQQRLTIRQLNRAVTECGGADIEVGFLARVARRFIGELRQDMLDEERDLLSPELFREDLVAIDQDAG